MSVVFVDARMYTACIYIDYSHECIRFRASVLFEDLALSFGMRAGDAIVAATAIESNLPMLEFKRFLG